MESLVQEIAEAYMQDDVPWVVGYSGGKDSTACLQLVWLALRQIGSVKATKPVYVISTDTLVENPIVAAWVSHSLEKVNSKATAECLPISAHRLTPSVSDSFWVNLIGRGYPAPRQKFRWCTERLKIAPSHRFISSMVDKHGETMLVLGTRRAESVARARTMKRHERGRVRDKISPNGTLANSLIYSPIEDWSNEDVWMFLGDVENPWGHQNIDLLEMYQGATPDGECPMVVDKGTRSCGDSRFGCWVCTLVEKDKSMMAMIHNDDEKKWMQPLLQIRSEIDFRAMPEGGDRHLRDYRRMSGNVQLMNGRVIPGPYKQAFREHLLKRVLEAQIKVQKTGPEYVASLDLIRIEELDEIRRIWLAEKHELEDSLPTLYEEVIGKEYPGKKIGDGMAVSMEELDILKDICGDNRNKYELTRELLSIAYKHRARRHGVMKSLTHAVNRHLHESEEEALKFFEVEEPATSDVL